MFKKPSPCWSFWYRSSLQFNTFPTFRSISLLLNIGKVDSDLPHGSTLSNWVSAGNGLFIFCKRRLEILVEDMIFDEIWTARSLACLSLITSGLVFMNRKRLHHRSRESRISGFKCILSRVPLNFQMNIRTQPTLKQLKKLRMFSANCLFALFLLS